jgi:4-hydroxy-tetrahydrodipicolinate reductase
MKIAIVGYGKMGRMVERVALERGHEIAVKLDDINNSNFEGITEENFRGVDAAIDFSIPSAAIPNIEKIASLKVNLVVGTTGWLDNLEDVKAAVEKNDIGLVWSPNFSVGVNAFFRIVAEATKLLSGEPEYKRGDGQFITQQRKTPPPVRC